MTNNLAFDNTIQNNTLAPLRADIEYFNNELSKHFESKFYTAPFITRTLVSFQGNKNLSTYRWYKYKEAFSAHLVEFFLKKYHIKSGKILDPFAGSGTALFAARTMGLDADGIELLPIGQQLISAKYLLENDFESTDFIELNHWILAQPWTNYNEKKAINELRITRDAYPEKTQEAMEKYLACCENVNPKVKAILKFALLCVLETISYTRKDGQYLRWDNRSKHQQGKNVFNKGAIVSFEQAITQKINEIVEDVKTANSSYNKLFMETNQLGNINLFNGSCLELLPKISSNQYDAIITSPPYCNRYDYTRTYALELAMLGIDERELIELRQNMLSCTVENRSKNLLEIDSNWSQALAYAENQELLQAILKYLNNQKEDGQLNNNGIPRMIQGYFNEMSCVIAECARIMKPNAIMIMINDNVRYAGISISVDMILSSLAEKLGLDVENIIILPKGKGNSSQQMGEHGREELRKCIYVWRKK